MTPERPGLGAMAVKVAIVVGALAAGTLVEWATGAPVPGRMPAFALGAAIVLVLGAKQLGRVVSRPVGIRAGEVGDPADDVAPAYGDVPDRQGPAGTAAEEHGDA